MVDLNPIRLDNTYQLSWCGHIDLNGLRYGNGSLKCWTKDFVKNMRIMKIMTVKQIAIIKM